jgi:F-type H+-transporting ATPase subunit delta
LKDLVVAQKYAHALFAEAQKECKGAQRCAPTLIACQQGLEEFIRVARLRGSLIQILSHPFIAVDEKKRLIHASLGDHAMALLERFLLLLVEKHRLNLLFAIGQEFQAEVDRFQNVQALKVRIAFPLSDSQQKDLQGKLEAWLKSKVRMEVQVDSSLIGGLVIETRHHVLDQSLQGQLKKLEGVLYGH